MSSMKEANESHSDSILDIIAGLSGLFVKIYNTIGVLSSTGILVICYSFRHLINTAGVVLDPE